MRTLLRAIGFVMLSALALAACRETGDVQVSSIKFEGMQAVQPDEIKAVIATRENGFLPWSRKHFFDREEFDRDVKRIEAYYADKGYPNAKVVGVDVQLNANKDKVDVTVEINEGAPVIVENISFEGLDAIPARTSGTSSWHASDQNRESSRSEAHPRLARYGRRRASRPRIPVRHSPSR